jgi:hypothetical protein
MYDMRNILDPTTILLFLQTTCKEGVVISSKFEGEEGEADVRDDKGIVGGDGRKRSGGAGMDCGGGGGIGGCLGISGGLQGGLQGSDRLVCGNFFGMIGTLLYFFCIAAEELWPFQYVVFECFPRPSAP